MSSAYVAFDSSCEATAIDSSCGTVRHDETPSEKVSLFSTLAGALGDENVKVNTEPVLSAHSENQRATVVAPTALIPVAYASSFEIHTPQRTSPVLATCGPPFTVPRPAEPATTHFRMSKPSRMSAPKVAAWSSLGDPIPRPKNTIFSRPAVLPLHAIAMSMFIAPAPRLAPPVTFPNTYAPTNTAPEPIHNAPVPFYVAPGPMFGRPSPFFAHPAAPEPIHNAPVPFHSAPCPMSDGPSPFFAHPAAFYRLPPPIPHAAMPVRTAPPVPQSPCMAGSSTSSQLGVNTQAAEGDRRHLLKRSWSETHYDDDGDDDYHFPLPKRPVVVNGKGEISRGWHTVSRQMVGQAPQQHNTKSWEGVSGGYIPEATAHPETFAQRVEGLEALPSAAEHSGSGTFLHQPAQVSEQPGAPAHTQAKAPRSTTKGVKTAYCTECNKWYGRHYEFERHLKSTKAHGAGRDFECPTCGTGFQRKDTMDQHQLIHLRGQAVAEEGWEEDWED